MEYNERHLSADEFELDRVDLARSLGYGPQRKTKSGDASLPARDLGRQMPAHMSELVETTLAEARPLLHPRWMWCVVEASLERDALICRGGRETRLEIGGIVKNQLRGCVAVAPFVVTIGSELERRARQLLPDAARSLEGYVLDTIGSVAVEAVGDALEREILNSVAERGWKITNRFSPGYCTWETVGQGALFSMFPESPAGVTLSSSCLMAPIKSISGVIGLGPDAEHRPYMCDLCSMTTCHQRLTDARL